MSTVDKVHKMFYKAASARRFNDKIMQKRAEIANRPSDAYIAGFCKTAEDVGVDPAELLNAASALAATNPQMDGASAQAR